MARKLTLEEKLSALHELSMEELQSLNDAVDRELDTRAFEEGLKRQVDWHLNKSRRDNGHARSTTDTHHPGKR